jgi:PKD repeat protein/dienelactone hydrolase
MAFVGKATMAAVLSVLLFAALLPGASPRPDSARPATPAGALQRAVERPDHTGPYPNAGFMYAQFQSSTKSYANDLKIFYPAQSAAENATPDTSGAPYPVILQLPFMGGDTEAYNGVAPLVVSWGFISVVIEPNWTDLQATGQANPNATDMNELLDMLELWNSTMTHKLSGMLQSNFGISGYSSGGGIAVIDGALVDRIRALQAMAPAVTDGTLDALAPNFHKPFQFQAGQNDSNFRPHSVHGYNVFPPPKAFLDVKDGTHGGPFYWDCMISFFMRYLKELAGYDSFLYGWGAMDDLSTVKYYLRFRLPDGTFFPAGIQAQGIPNMVNISEPVSFNGLHDGYLPMGHPNGSFKWDFQSDGAVDRADPLEPNTTYAYDRSGEMSVSLWYAIGEYRISCNNSLTITVRNQLPTVKLNDSYSALEDGTLQLTAEASDTPADNASLHFTWEFGDGRTQGPGPERSVLHKYTRAGNFTLRVTVRDPPGASAIATAKVTISDIPPAVQPGPDISVEKDSLAQLTGSGSGTPADLPGMLFCWAFGDKNSTDWSSDPNATHTYTWSGNYTAVLSAKDDEGTVSTGSLKVAVENRPPAAKILSPGPGAVFDKDKEVQFGGAAADTASDAPFLLHRWDFGDGNLSEWSASPDATHIYTRGGAKTVRFQSRDTEGAVGEAAVNISVRNQAPKVSILSPWITEAEEDSPVQFNAEGDDTASDEEALNYTWVIDGETFFGASFEHSFTTEGVKQLMVTARDPEGASSSASRTININNREPKLNAMVTPPRIYANQSILFSATASDSASDKPSLSISWNFGDGSISTAFSGSHNYTKAGTYDVLVTVTDDEDATDSQSFKVIVDPLVEPPVVPPVQDDGGQSTGIPVRTIAIAAGAVVAMAVLAVVIILLMRRRRPLAPAPVPPTQPSEPPDQLPHAATPYPPPPSEPLYPPPSSETPISPPPSQPQYAPPPSEPLSPPPQP